MRKSGREGGVCIFIHKSLDYKVRKDLSINCDAIESLSIDICNGKTRNTIETRMETQKSANSFVKIYFLKIAKT